MATKNANALTTDRARELLRYDPETGVLTWCVTRCNRALVGAEAGNINPTDGYRRVMIDGRHYKAHRVAFLLMMGRWPHDQLDHEDHDRLNNRWKNLKETDNQGNHRNRRLSSKNTSGYIGVSWYKRDDKWLAHIKLDGRTKNLGCFDELTEAVAARKAAEIKYGFHKNHGRAFP